MSSKVKKEKVDISTPKMYLKPTQEDYPATQEVKKEIANEPSK